MQARAQLMIEHRLIERMLLVVKRALDGIESTRRIDPVFVDMAVDFIRVYADRTHHGKEEDILFQKLNNKPLTDDDRKAMSELIEDHIFSRRTTRAIVEANDRYRNGDEAALGEMVDRFQTLIAFYPRHIVKEDKLFFPASRKYFTDAEDQDILKEFREFDWKMIHEKYNAMVEKWEG